MLDFHLMHSKNIKGLNFFFIIWAQNSYSASIHICDSSASLNYFFSSKAGKAIGRSWSIVKIGSSSVMFAAYASAIVNASKIFAEIFEPQFLVSSSLMSVFQKQNSEALE